MRQWFGNIPENWGAVKMRNIFTERSIKVSDKDYPALSVGYMGVVPQLETAAKTDNGDNRKLICKGDFAINSRSDRKGAGGISNYDGSASLIITVLKPNEDIDGNFYHYLLRSHYFSEEFYRNGRGLVSDLWTTNWNNMRNILIPLPPLSEQNQIVRFLDHKVSRIDKLISIRQQQITELEDLKKAIINKAVTKGLNPDVPMKDSGVKWIGDIPEYWEERFLESEIKSILLSSRSQAYSAVNFAMVQAYWQIGRVIVEHEQNGSLRAEYGKATLQEVSEKLRLEFGESFSVRNLQQMKKFYALFQNPNALRSQLSWTHYRTLLRIEDETARNWYIEECIKSAWSSRQLERQISTLYYERLLASREKEPVIAEADKMTKPLSAENFIKDPYVLDFLDLKNYPALRESELEQMLIDKLQEFLLELGRGFCFVARQKLMRYDDDDFYLDLVFYHSILKCHVLIDLKIGKLTHGDVGQMDSYIRMFDALYKNSDDNPTIGIILCSQKNEAIVKYSVLSEAKQVFASKYQLTLPTAEELQREIEKERRKIEEQED